MISKNRELLEKKVDIANKRYKINDKNLLEVLQRICKEIMMGNDCLSQ